MEGSSHFAISTNFLANEQSPKANLKNGSRSSNRAIQTSKMKKEEVDHQISTTRFLASVEEDEILTTRMLTEDFNVVNSTIVRRLKKLRKVWKLAVWVPTLRQQQNRTCLNLHRFAAEKRANAVSEESRHGSSSKRPKERRIEFWQVFYPKDYRKASTVRRQCGVISKKFVEIAKWLCCIPFFLVDSGTALYDEYECDFRYAFS